MNLGFLVSHNGSNMQAIIDACKSGKLSAIPIVAISNNKDSGALQRATSECMAVFHINSKTEGSEESADRKIAQVLSSYNVDIVILAGYMRKIGSEILKKFPNRVINIHPALLPKFGGQGMYGHNVHAAVLSAGEKETGVTIHLVNEEYDKGRILSQASVPVLSNDTCESLSKRVLELEHKLYPETIADIVNNKIKLQT